MTTADDAARADTDTQDTATATTDTGSTNADTTQDTAAGDTLTADELAKWKSLARKHEIEAKKAAKALADAQQAQMSEQERAIAEAETRGAQTVRGEFAQRLAAAELKAAGVPADVIEDLNLARYIGDDGEVNADAITATAAKFAAAKPRPVQVPTGAQNGGQKPQLTRDDLKGMTPDDIVKAEAEGRLTDLLAGKS